MTELAKTDCDVNGDLLVRCTHSIALFYGRCDIDVPNCAAIHKDPVFIVVRLEDNRDGA